VLEGFQVIQEGVEQIKQMQEETGGGLLGKLLTSFGELKSLLEGWEHAFDWEKAKEEGISVPDKVDL
jgi:hypothetical protein